MATTYKHILIGAFVSSFLGALVAPILIKPEISSVATGITPLPKCGPEGHPDTGSLVIVFCSEN